MRTQEFVRGSGTPKLEADLLYVSSRSLVVCFVSLPVDDLHLSCIPRLTVIPSPTSDIRNQHGRPHLLLRDETTQRLPKIIRHRPRVPTLPLHLGRFLGLRFRGTIHHLACFDHDYQAFGDCGVCVCFGYHHHFRGCCVSSRTHRDKRREMTARLTDSFGQCASTASTSVPSTSTSLNSEDLRCSLPGKLPLRTFTQNRLTMVLINIYPPLAAAGGLSSFGSESSVGCGSWDSSSPNSSP